MRKPKLKPSYEMTDQEYLRDLSERLMHVPVMHGTDQYDVDRLLEMARKTAQ